MEELTGAWLLSGTFALKSDVPFVEGRPVRRAVTQWLGGGSDDVLDQINDVTGLRLTIQGDGSFTEEKIGDPKITWYDSEGVLQNTVNPFDGTVSFSGGKGYLMSDENQTTPRTIRYDDGDTKICDWVAVHAGKLIRTVSVVTDELYLDRILLRYDREE